MQHYSGLHFAPTFVPVVGNYYKGLAVTVFLTPWLLARPVTPTDLHALFAGYYVYEPFIRVMPVGDESNLDNHCFDVQGCNDTNRTDLVTPQPAPSQSVTGVNPPVTDWLGAEELPDLFVFGAGEQIVVMARLDNLGKGSAGAAIQCRNIHLGLAEMTGLQ